QRVDGADDFLQVFRLVDVGGGVGVDLVDQFVSFRTQIDQQLSVVVFQLDSLQFDQVIPTVFRRELGFVFHAFFFQHFEEKDIGELGYVLMVGNTVVPEHIAQVPQFLYDFLVVHACSFSFSFV